MKRVWEGYQQFRRELFGSRQPLFQRLAKSQSPEVLFITCADSRVVPNLITNTEPGELFICRNAGNIVPPYGERMGGVSATIEYAVAALGVKNVVICGHSDCGAMKGVLHPEKVQSLPAVSSWLQHADAAARVVQENYAQLSEEAKLDILVEENVIAQLENLKTHPTVASALARGELNLYGWTYHIDSGEIEAYDAAAGRFVPLDSRLPAATPRPRIRVAALQGSAV